MHFVCYHVCCVFVWKIVEWKKWITIRDISREYGKKIVLGYKMAVCSEKTENFNEEDKKKEEKSQRGQLMPMAWYNIWRVTSICLISAVVSLIYVDNDDLNIHCVRKIDDFELVERQMAVGRETGGNMDEICELQ